MEALPWFWIWIIAAAVLFIGEMLSLSFFMLPFAVGAVVAAIFCALDLGIVWQIIAFVVTSVLSLVALRPLAKRLTRKAGPTKVGAERLVGEVGKVIEGKSQAGWFRINVSGEIWNATTEDEATLEPETPIEVLAVNSNLLIVKELHAKTGESEGFDRFES